MDNRRVDVSQDANKTKMGVFCADSSDSSDSDSSREFEPYVGAYGDLCAAFQADYKRIGDSSKPKMDAPSIELHGISDVDYTPDIEVAIASCRDSIALRETEKKYRQELEAYVGGLRDSLVAHKAESKLAVAASKSNMDKISKEMHETLEVDINQEYQTFGDDYRGGLDARQIDKRAKHFSVLEHDIHLSDLDYSSDTDTSEEFEAYIGACAEFASCITQTKLAQNDESLDVCSKMEAIREVNARLEKNREVLRRSIEKREDDITRLKDEVESMRRLKDLLFRSEAVDELELEEVIESFNNLLPKRKK